MESESPHSHIRELLLGCHANHALQSDFLSFGASRFEAQLLVRGGSPSRLRAVEADRIRSLLNAGMALYNLTLDGQGIGGKFHGYSNSQPISDRRVRPRGEPEGRWSYRLFAKTRQNTSDVSQLNLPVLRPQMTFWTYFVATFVCAFAILAILM